MRITASWSGSLTHRIEGCGTIVVHHRRAPLGLCYPDTTKCAGVLEAVKDEPSVGADAPILDRFSARRLRIRVSVRVGTKKRALQVEQRN